MTHHLRTMHDAILNPGRRLEMFRSPDGVQHKHHRISRSVQIIRHERTHKLWSPIGPVGSDHLHLLVDQCSSTVFVAAKVRVFGRSLDPLQSFLGHVVLEETTLSSAGCCECLIKSYDPNGPRCRFMCSSVTPKRVPIPKSHPPSIRLEAIAIRLEAIARPLGAVGGHC